MPHPGIPARTTAAWLTHIGSAWVAFALSLAALASTRCRGASADPLAHLRAGHPRLLFTDADLREAIAAARIDPLRSELHAKILATAEALLKAPVPQHVSPAGEHSLDETRYEVFHITTCAMAYRLSGDPRFADRVRTELLAICAFPDWGPDHFLDVGETSFAVALGYDWIYGRLSEGERAVVREALVQKALRFAEAAYHANGGTGSRVEWAVQDGNWNQVCNAGILCAALAVADEKPRLARDVLTGALASLSHGMGVYRPDGEYPEGPGYWTYGTTYAVMGIAALQTALGTDLGLSSYSGFSQTGLYELAIQAPSGRAFNYADSTDDLQNSPARAWLAERFRDPITLRSTRAELRRTLAEPGVVPFDPTIQGQVENRFFALHAVWFPRDTPVSAGREPPLDLHFRGVADIAVFRSAWNDPDAVFVGFKCGRNTLHHNHLDLGSFVLDASGVRWAVDLGPDSYLLPGYFDFDHGGRWAYFRTTNLSHNTVAPGEALQAPAGNAPIIAFGSSPGRAYAVADLTAAYPGRVTDLKRGIALLDRSKVLIQDEYTPGARLDPLHWRMVTQATIALSEDRRRAELSLGGERLRVEVLEPPSARLEEGSTLPPSRLENQNPGTRLLEIEMPVTEPTSSTLAVLLTPERASRSPSLTRPELKPLAQWAAP